MRVRENESVAVAGGNTNCFGVFSIGGTSDFAESGFRDGRATGVGKAENFCDFIKTLTDGIVVGGADDFKMIVLTHMEDLGVAAGND